LYYQGLPVDFGIDSKGDFHEPLPSIPESRVDIDQSLYKSPVELSCQENFVVLISDGDPTSDTNANARIEAQPNFSTLVGPACDGTGEGACLDDMTEYLFETDIRDDLDGRQYSSTYTIGFTIDSQILRDAAESGGGQYYFADDTASLSSALIQTVLDILDTSATFTAPSVSVNAFNRTQTLNDLFISVFESSGNEHWPGNLKKYALKNGVIVDANDNPAVDANSGFFSHAARSFWSANTDGSDVRRGGAANQLPNPFFRNLYTYVDSYPVPAGGSLLTLKRNEFDTGNNRIRKSTLNIGNLGDPKKVDLIRWARGVDVNDDDQDGDTNDPRNVMGDPLHAKPATVVYGGTASAPDIDDAVVFSGNNDGYLHAIDAKTGSELWGFVPQEQLGILKQLYFNSSTADKHYGVDGDMRTLTIDVNRNGIIEPLDGDKIYLYFGMRRGGYKYYALDVTSKTSPILMWVKDINDLPHLGQTWSSPITAKVNIAGATQNADKNVLVFGGGYDGTQDNTTYSNDLFGNAIYMLDAVSGELLWWAGNDPAADLTLSAMNNSIPGEIRVLDLDSDGFADRMYAADMGGRIFRFDIFNGQFADSLATGGVFASLGAADLAAPTLADTRRLYNAPDTAVIASGGQRYLNVSLGSGYRAHPLETGVNDRFYALRDYDLFRQMSQLEYDTLVPITDSDPNLVDITVDPAATLPIGARGWKLNLSNPGEKVLAESRTFDNRIFFTTYSPENIANVCRPNPGTNRLYAISAINAAPFTDLDQDGDLGGLDIDDRSRTLKVGGIAPDVVFLFPSADDPSNCVGRECAPKPECIVGLEVCDPGFDNDPIRTFWNQEGAE
jgi:type IV pilus assembly protein PilY1